MADKKAVLLIEDNADARHVFALMLDELGYSVTECDGAAEAIEKLSTGTTCDVVVTDLKMPETSGFELRAMIRRWRPKTPVVLMTGDREAIETALDKGFIPLLKPFSVEQLGVVLAEALRRGK